MRRLLFRTCLWYLFLFGTACSIGSEEPAEDGHPCQWDIDCESGLCLPEYSAGEQTGWTDGMCTSFCPAGDCAEGTTCVRLCDGNYCLPTCEDSAHCRPGYVCTESGACLPDCRSGFDCGEFECSEEGQCLPPSCDLGLLGAPCASDARCDSGVCFESTDDDGPTGWTDGMCTEPCTENCPGKCVVIDSTAWCLPACEDSASCRSGYLCDDSGACLPDCRLGWDCGDGYVCGDDGRCEVDTSNLASFGEPCTADHTCETGVCFEETDEDGATGWIDGICARPCTDSCPGGCVVLDGEPWCLPSCATADDCRTGYVCSDDSSVCLPDCRLDWDCGDDYICADDGQCEPGWTELNELGDACSSHASCETGLCLLFDSGPCASLNTSVCTASCQSGCTTGFECVPVGAINYCLPSCSSDTECPPDFACSSASGACIPACL